MDKEALIDEIKNAFPETDMPASSELTFHLDGCIECEDLIKDLNEHRGKPVTDELIREVHQELSNLSAKSWRWILPHYLQFCLTPQAEESRMELEFLIYALSPSPEFRSDTSERLAELDNRQLECVIRFFEAVYATEYWNEYCGDDIKSAINFLTNLVATRRK